MDNGQLSSRARLRLFARVRARSRNPERSEGPRAESRALGLQLPRSPDLPPPRSPCARFPIDNRQSAIDNCQLSLFNCPYPIVNAYIARGRRLLPEGLPPLRPGQVHSLAPRIAWRLVVYMARGGHRLRPRPPTPVQRRGPRGLHRRQEGLQIQHARARLPEGAEGPLSQLTLAASRTHPLAQPAQRAA